MEDDEHGYCPQCSEPELEYGECKYCSYPNNQDYEWLSVNDDK